MYALLFVLLLFCIVLHFFFDLLNPLLFLCPKYSDKIIRLLGEGTFGKVVECEEQGTGRKVAVKVIKSIQKVASSSSWHFSCLLFGLTVFSALNFFFSVPGCGEM